MTITTTLNRIRLNSPCTEGWQKLLTHLGKSHADDEPLPYATILASNGLNDTIWCMGCEPIYAQTWRLFAVACAREVQHLMKDQRSITALDVAELFAHGQATPSELAVAYDAAMMAANTAAYTSAAIYAAAAAAFPAAANATQAAVNTAYASATAAGAFTAARDSQAQLFMALVT